MSALNILNEAEVNFKMARNKRLHVELVIIKLNFLQQAIELSNQDGNVVKKKRVDGPVAINYTPVTPVQIVTHSNTVVTPSGKLYVEEKKPVVAPKAPQPAPLEPATKSAVATPQPQQPTTTYQPVATSPDNAVAGNGKKNILDALRNKYGDRYTIEAVKDPIPVTLESLQPHWEHFISKLKEEGKISQANAFATCTIEIIDDSSFTVKVDSTLQQKFIEQEKTVILDYLQRHHHNKLVVFNFFVNEGEREIVEKPLNSKERFEKMASQYPLLRTLRDNLKMDIDY